jgi:hypothetical protein
MSSIGLSCHQFVIHRIPKVIHIFVQVIHITTGDRGDVGDNLLTRT